MNSHFGCIKAFLILFSVTIFTACGGNGENQSSSSENPISINLSVSGPSVASEGELVVLTAVPESHENDVYYVWSQVGGKPIEWVGTEDQIEVHIPRLHDDAVFTFEVYAVGESQASDPVQHSISVTDVFELQSAVEPATATAITSLTRLLKFGNLARNLLSQSMLSVDIDEVPCANGGLYTSTLLDNDANAQLSADDGLMIEFKECNIEPFRAPLSGNMLMEVTEFVAIDDSWRVNVNVDDLEVEGYDVEQMSAVLTIVYSEADRTRSMAVDVPGGSYHVNGVELYSFSDYSVVRKEDLRAATYQISASAQFADSSLGGNYTFEVNTPLVGHFNEYPHEGNATLTSSETDRLLLESNFVTDSAFINVTGDDGETKFQWNNLTNGVFWSFGNEFIDHGQYFRSDNFEYVGQANVINLEAAPLDASFLFIFSRPIDNVPTSDVVFEEEQFPYNEIPAEISVDGAALSITPAQPFIAGVEYNLSGIQVVGPFGQTAFARHIRFTTSSALSPVITTATRFYNYNDTPILSATDSELNEGQTVTYHWDEITEYGVVFDSPNSETTSFTVPAGLEEDLVIQLTMSNELGNSASAQITLTALPDADTFIALDSETGDYIGGGVVHQYIPEAGTISSTSNLQSPDVISVRFNDDDDRWSMEIAAPNGEALAVQSYLNAERYPFQMIEAPGFSFTGNGRGCNRSYSDFEILELEYDEAGDLFRLAVDFVQHCESPTAPALKGMVRFNSALNVE